MATAEQHARENIDQLLEAVGWRAQNFKRAHIRADRGAALREFPPLDGHGCADYLFYPDGKVASVIEGKRAAARRLTSRSVAA